MGLDTIGTSHETPVEGTSIAWSELGAGPPLVLLHGIGDSHRTWRRAAPLLARDFRVLMPDLPGHGWSGRPDASYTLDWHGWMVARWLEATGVTNASVCGHAFGGNVAQWLLLDRGSRVERLALVAPGELGQDVSPAMRIAALPVLGLALTPPIMWLGVLFGPRLLPDRFGPLEPEEARILVRMNRIRGTARAYRRSLAGVVNRSGQAVRSIERVHESVAPAVALFWGVEDAVSPVRCSTGLLVRFEGARLTVYPGCGHFPQLELHPAFARDLGEFLRDPRGVVG